MKTLKKSLLATSVLLATTAATSVQAESAIDEISKAISSGKTKADINLRYETVDQDNALKDADALTVRARFTYATGEYKGFSAVAGFEHVQAITDDYEPFPMSNPKEYSVIADPEVTEVDQGYLQYKNEKLTAKLGAQVIALDNQRHIGHVGWRQDRQTFDALSASYKATEDLSVYYAYIQERNRIFGEVADIQADDHLVNISYKSPVGKVVGYAYMLETDAGAESDTYGISLNGSTKGDVKFIYGAEFATQEAGDIDADYMSLTAGTVLSGFTIKANYEVLGSDDGMGAFSTPLATGHAFNGWSDQFLGTPATGLVDMNFKVSTKVLGGKFLAAYHMFEADEGSAEYGDEINVLYAKKLNKNYTAGVKFAMYSADDLKVDTDKLWIWLNAKF